MKTLELHDLEDRITEVMQSMQDTGETVAVTKDGKIIAHLVPAGFPDLLAPASLPQWLTQPSDGDVWTNLNRLRDEISAHWPEGVSAVDAIRDVRREL